MTTPSPETDQQKLDAEVTQDDAELTAIETRDAQLEQENADLTAQNLTLAQVVTDLKAQPTAGGMDFTKLDAFSARVNADAVAVAVAAPMNPITGQPASVLTTGAPINPVNGQPATTILTTAPAATVLDVSTGAAVIAPTQGVNPPLASAPVVDPNVPAGAVESVPVAADPVPVQAPATEAPAPASGSAPATTDPAAPAVVDPAVVDAPVADAPVVEAPVTVVAPDTRSTYTFDGDPSTVDHAEWPDAGTRPDGTPLFHFTGDTAPGDAKGVGGPWQLDTAGKA